MSALISQIFEVEFSKFSFSTLTLWKSTTKQNKKGAQQLDFNIYIYYVN